MKLFELISMAQTLSDIIDKKLPFSLAYKVSNLISVVDKNRGFYDKSLKQLLDEYAEKDDEGSIKQSDGNVILTSNKTEEFYEKLNQLQEVEVTDNLPTFTQDELGTIELSPRDILSLKSLIEEN